MHAWFRPSVGAFSLLIGRPYSFLDVALDFQAISMGQIIHFAIVQSRNLQRYIPRRYISYNHSSGSSNRNDQGLSMSFSCFRRVCSSCGSQQGPHHQHHAAVPERRLRGGAGPRTRAPRLPPQAPHRDLLHRSLSQAQGRPPWDLCSRLSSFFISFLRSIFRPFSFNFFVYVFCSFFCMYFLSFFLSLFPLFLTS